MSIQFQNTWHVLADYPKYEINRDGKVRKDILNENKVSAAEVEW